MQNYFKLLFNTGLIVTILLIIVTTTYAARRFEGGFGGRGSEGGNEYRFHESPPSSYHYHPDFTTTYHENFSHIHNQSVPRFRSQHLTTNPHAAQWHAPANFNNQHWTNNYWAHNTWHNNWNNWSGWNHNGWGYWNYGWWPGWNPTCFYYDPFFGPACGAYVYYPYWMYYQPYYLYPYGYNYPVITNLYYYDIVYPDNRELQRTSTNASEPLNQTTSGNAPPPNNEAWISAAKGRVPTNAVLNTDADGNPTYYCRSKYMHKLHYGVLVPNDGCYVEQSNLTMRFTNYEVLVTK